MNRSNIHTCINCHVNGAIPGAPQITSHKPEKTNKSSCEACHDLVKLNPGLNDIGSPIPNITSHYARLPAVPTTNYCDYCHGPNASSPFQAPYRNITSFFHNSSNASFPDNTNCRTCHIRTDVIADPLANNNSNFHELTTEYGDVKNNDTGVVANCIYCHIDHNTIFVNAPSPSHSIKDMVLDNCYLCHGTKVTGTNKQKLHDVRSFVTTGCIPCHEVLNDINTSMFGRHINLNTTEGGQNNMTDDDCMTCHFGSRIGDLPMIPGGANYNNTYECDDCHTTKISNATPKATNFMITTFKHGSNECISCHAPDVYHVKGTAGPRGRVENPGWQLISPVDYTGCLDCHLTHNGLDAPFHGPGIDPNTTSGTPKNHMATSGSPKNGSGCKDSCHLYGVHRVTQSTNSKKPTLSTPVLFPTIVANNEPVEVTSRGSAQDGFTSLQIEAAQYRIYNSNGQTILDWTAMNAKDGRFNSSLETVNATISTTGLSEGTYNVSVRVMASGPKSSILPYKLLPYYPLNGDWSNPLNATFTIKQERVINGTVRNTSGSVIAGATITAKNLISGLTYPALTDDMGFYSLSLSNGTYGLIASKDPEYKINNTTPPVDLEFVTTATRDIILTKKAVGTISGIVTRI
jgi:nitrate/TMAO reductase-like tetraheme cytochrome c subunit